MAAKAVPTALGALWAFALTALLAPNYASNGVLARQAGVLRDSFRELCRRVRFRGMAAVGSAQGGWDVRQGGAVGAVEQR